MSEVSVASKKIAGRVWRVPVADIFSFRRIGYLFIGLQLIGFLAWSEILYRRFALTSDFSVYHQAWYLIAHGNLDPYSTVWGLPFWRNDSEFALWLLAPFYWIWPHGVTLLWLQDIGIAVAELVAFTWMFDLLRKRNLNGKGVWLAAGGLVLLIMNPWIWWAVSFDFHEEAIAIPFALLLARDLTNGRRRAWLWVAPILLCGAQTAVYVAGLAIGSLLYSRRSRLMSALMIGVSVAYSLAIVFVHGDEGAAIAHIYGYLVARPPAPPPTFTELVKGIIADPGTVLRVLWQKRVDMYANLAPSGLIGLGDLFVLPLTLAVLISDTLVPGLNFSEPLFQALPIYILLPVGTVAVMGVLARRHRKVAMVVFAIIIAQALGWAGVWGSRTASQWLRVPAPAARTLASIERRISPAAEVIASQGILGPFTGRSDVMRIEGQGRVPLSRRVVWFVLAPSAGIELQSAASAADLIGRLAGPLHATLILHENGIWAFRWVPPPRIHFIIVNSSTEYQPVWAAPLSPGTAGVPIMSGNMKYWHVASTGGRGYVADGVEWLKPPGRYTALIRMSASRSVNVEVWNDTGKVLLARRAIPATPKESVISIPVNATTDYTALAYSGWGPFRADFVHPPRGEQLEVRIWSPGGCRVDVYGARLVSAVRQKVRGGQQRAPASR